MRYLNQGDSIRTKWLDYEYRSVWKFKGGGGFETDWKTDNSAMVNLFVPFQRRSIQLDGDLSALKTEDVRAVSVQIEYPFFNQIKTHRVTIRPTDNLEEKAFEITLPNSVEEVSYDITWIRRNKPALTKSGTDKYGLIFIDELPNE